MVIQHNMSALFTNTQLGITQSGLAKTTEKLSSGYRVNRAADDAAGLSISEKMRWQIRGLNKASNNIQDGISYVQVADGALSTVDDMLHRMNELCVQGANDTNTSLDRAALNSEIQELKKEITRIFETTTFNTKVIWEADNSTKVPVPGETQPAMLPGTYNGINVTNANAPMLSNNASYKVSADADSIIVSWTGFDSNSYSKTIPTKDFIENPTIDLSSEGVALQRTYSVSPDAKPEEIAASLNGTTFSTTNVVYFGSSLASDNGVSYVSTNNFILNMGPAYESYDNGKLSFDTSDNKAVFAPAIPSGKTTNLDTSSGWKFSLNLDGYGPVSAVSKSMSYRATNMSTPEGGTWWYSNKTSSGTYNYYRTRTVTPVDMTGISNALTGAADTDTPGLLSSANNGADSNGGMITIGFDLKNSAGASIGSYSLDVHVLGSDTEQDVIDRVNNALGSGTVLTPEGMSDSLSGHTFSVHKTEIPIYESVKALNIQAGAQEEQAISIQYKSLSLANLGITHTNCLSYDNASDGITAVANAVDFINTQRSVFGAYQNRLEHAYNNDTNTSENTQSAESRIRDANIAEEMLHYSASSIIAQAGESMLSQSNSSMEHILSLLQ